MMNMVYQFFQPGMLRRMQKLKNYIRLFNKREVTVNGANKDSISSV